MRNPGSELLRSSLIKARQFRDEGRRLPAAESRAGHSFCGQDFILVDCPHAPRRERVPVRLVARALHLRTQRRRKAAERTMISLAWACLPAGSGLPATNPAPATTAAQTRSFSNPLQPLSGAARARRSLGSSMWVTVRREFCGIPLRMRRYP